MIASCATGSVLAQYLDNRESGKGAITENNLSVILCDKCPDEVVWYGITQKRYLTQLVGSKERSGQQDDFRGDVLKG